MKITRGRIIQVISVFIVHVITLFILQRNLSGFDAVFTALAGGFRHCNGNQPIYFLVGIYQLLSLAAILALSDPDLCLERSISSRDW